MSSDRPLVGSTLLNGETFDADQAVNEDAVLVIASSDLLANDVDPDLDPDLNAVVDEVLSIVIAQPLSVSGASVTYDDDTGMITYDPSDSLAAQSLAPGESLVDTFSYSLRDSAGDVSISTVVSVNVAGVNDAPRLEADAPQFNPAGPTVFNPLVNDSDVDGSSIRSPSSSRRCRARGAISTAPDGTMTYTPFGEFTGDDLFQYTVADDLGDRSEPATVTISANAAPIGRDDQGSGFLNESFVINVLSNDFDPDGPLTLTVPANGSGASFDQKSFSVNVEGRSETFLFTTDENLNSDDNLIIVAPTDSAEIVASSVAARIREVFPETLLSSAMGRVITLGEQTGAVSVLVESSELELDGGLDLGSIRIVDDPSRGQAVPQGDGTILYMPDPGFLDTDSFQYTVNDSLGRASTPTDVDVRVVASRLQNPDENSDVNGSGEVSAIDALLVINLLNRPGNAGGIPVEPGDRGPNFYDVNGDRRISPSDAFRVINELNRRSATGGTPQGEAAPGIDAAIATLAPPQSSAAVAPTGGVVARDSLAIHSAEGESDDVDPIRWITGDPIRQIAIQSPGLPTVIDMIAEAARDRSRRRGGLAGARRGHG